MSQQPGKAFAVLLYSPANQEGNVLLGQQMRSMPQMFY